MVICSLLPASNSSTILAVNRRIIDLTRIAEEKLSELNKFEHICKLNSRETRFCVS